MARGARASFALRAPSARLPPARRAPRARRRSADQAIGDDPRMKVCRRSARRRARTAMPSLDVARRMLEELGRTLDAAILVDGVDGDGPVTVRATILRGANAVSVTVEAATEAEALVELGRRVIRVTGADEGWLRRYGLGMG